ncbi:MAG: histidinol-phosphatase HisJ family protein [Clostridia bacterium]|nr:histidinol-phosphatase HisJ family protein [Clostridia bacterium]
MMNSKQNLHTHTTYCDGKHNMREIIEIALNKGFGSLGFSEHSYMYFAPERSMSLEDTVKYKAEIKALKEEYKDRIKIYCGLEVEMYSQIDLSDYDYLIGDSHFLNIDGELIGFDRPLDTVKDIIKRYFNGNGMDFALNYWKSLATLPEHGNFDIIGHIDLITKHLEKEPLFDTEDIRYKKAALEAIDALNGKIPFFEVNTGVIARGYRHTPYPSPFLLKELCQRGFKAVITSDCHNAEMLDTGFDLARELLTECGFKERYILTDSGFEAVEI